MAINRNVATVGQGLVFVQAGGKVMDVLDDSGKPVEGPFGPLHGGFILTSGSGAEKTKEVLAGGSDLVGYVSKVEVKESKLKNGDVVYNLAFRIKDGNEPVVQVSVALGTYNAAKWIGLLNGADLSRQLSFNIHTVKAGDVINETKFDADHVFPSIRYDDKKGERVVPVWANGLTELPVAPTVMVSGKPLKNMDPVNAVVSDTIVEVQTRLAQVLGNRHADIVQPEMMDEDLDVGEVAESVERARQS